MHARLQGGLLFERHTKISQLTIELSGPQLHCFSFNHAGLIGWTIAASSHRETHRSQPARHTDMVRIVSTAER